MGSPASGFDLLAPVYDALQRLFFGRCLVRAQNHFLGSVPQAGKVLILGGGTGKILLEMLRLGTGQVYHYVDVSKRMIRATKRRVRLLYKEVKSTANRPAIHYFCADINRMPLDRYDLIVTPFVLDCLQDEALSALVPRLAGSLTAHGVWLFTDFHIPQGLMQYPARFLIRLLYFCFNRVCELDRNTLPDFASHFERAHLQKRAEFFYLKGMLTACVYEHHHSPTIQVDARNF